MSGALYMAASGAANHQVKMDVLANNLANINTTGFKRELAVFRELALPGSSVASENPPSAPENAYRHLSTIPVRTYTDHSPGAFTHTGGNLDLALEGKGFFCIKTPSGEQYTRKGEFRISEGGLLTTMEGHPVMSERGEINIEGGKPWIDEKGNITVNGANVNTIKVVEFDNLKDLHRVSDNLFEARDQVRRPRLADETLVQQGYLEKSNVNPVAMMTEMITVLRCYQSYQKAIHAMSEMTSKAINDVGKLN